MILSFVIFVSILFSSVFGWAQDSSAETAKEKVKLEVPKDPLAEEEPKDNDDSSEASPNSKMEKVEVTGSHIKRIDVEGPSPLLVFDQDDILRSGQNSVSDILRDAGVSSHGSFREVGGQVGAGTSAVDLRGLGQERTLVLLDGQRLPSDAFAGSVDLNMIPMAAVERIEVLKDGASAIYGSDALGGVVNIITKKEFSGHELGSTMTFTEQRGGERRDLSYTSGYSTSRFNLVNVVYLRHNERILAEDREWSQINFSSTGSPGSYTVDGTEKPDPRCPSGLVRAQGDRCLYNFGEEKWEMPYLLQGSVMSRATYEVNDSLTAIGRVNYTYKEVDWVRSPVPVSGLTMPAAPADLGADAGKAVTNVRYRFRELGNRESKTKTNVAGALVGFKGYAGDSWDWQTNLSFNRVDRRERRTGYALKADIQKAIDDGDFNPFAAEGQRGDLSGLGYEPTQESISENTFFEAKATGELTDSISIAFGTQAIRELYKDAADGRTLNDEVLSLASSQGGGERNSGSLFTEVGFSFSDKFETLAALRYDHYEGFGDTINPKLSMRYNPMKELMFRASAGTGFKAPQMQRLFAAQTVSSSQFIDQVHCNNPNGGNGDLSNPACQRQSLPVVEGGNPNLKEETSFSFNLGTVVQPARHHSFGFDFWYYDLENLVEAPNFQQLTQQEADGVDISQYGATATRNPTTGELTGRGLEASFLNIAQTETQGLDFFYNGTMKTSVGDFKLRVQHSHMIYYKREGLPGTGVTDRLLDFGRPQWRNNITFLYIPEKSKEYSLLARTIGHHSKTSSAAGQHPTYTEYDFRFSWLINSLDGKLTLGINNILGSVQPYDDSVALDPDLYYNLYDGRGRALLVGYRQTF